MAARKRVRINYFKFIRSILLICLVVAGISAIIYNGLINPKKTYDAEYSSLDMEESYDAYVIRKEYVVRTFTTGPVKFNIKEGQRVESGERLFTQKCTVGYDKSSGAGSREASKEPSSQAALKKEIDEYTASLSSSIRSGKYGDVDTLRARIESGIASLNSLNESTGKGRLDDTGFRELAFGGESVSIGQKDDFYTTVRGYATFNMDGYESLITLGSIYSLDVKKVKGSSIKGENVFRPSYASGSAVMKIIDDSVWYMALFAPVDRMDMYEVDKEVTVNVDSTEITGKVADAFGNSEGGGTVIVKLDEFTKKLMTDRVVQVKVKVKDHEGIRIYPDSIADKDGVKGVYVIDIEGNPDFVEILELGRKDSNVIVKDGYFNKYVEGKLVRVKTVDKSDRILRHGDRWN